MKLLHIDASIQNEQSVSRQLAMSIVKRLAAPRQPGHSAAPLGSSLKTWE